MQKKAPSGVKYRYIGCIKSPSGVKYFLQIPWQRFETIHKNVYLLVESFMIDIKKWFEARQKDKCSGNDWYFFVVDCNTEKPKESK